MYEVTFSEQSMAELNRLEVPQQMVLIEAIGQVTADRLAKPREPLSKFEREEIEFYRLRADDYRFYFVVHANQLFCHYILHKNSVADFAFRNGWKLTEEQAFEQDGSFWNYLEGLRKTKEG